MDNIVPLNHPGNNKLWITVFYENLLTNPQDDIPHIFNRLNMEFPRNLWDEINIPSAMVQQSSQLQQNNIEQLSKWKNELSEKDINAILDMLKKFEMNIYDDNIFPVKLSEI